MKMLTVAVACLLVGITGGWYSARYVSAMEGLRQTYVDEANSVKWNFALLSDIQSGDMDRLVYHLEWDMRLAEATLAGCGNDICQRESIHEVQQAIERLAAYEWQQVESDS